MVAEEQPPLTVGVISDTHGLLRPEAMEALRGSDLIVHAGDIGDPSLLDRLREIAPTVAVRGNVDTAPWTRILPATEVVQAGALQLYVLHDLAELDLDPAAAGFAAVISGHTHRPAADVRRGVLFLNPGSAGPRRFKLPVALARLQVSDRQLTHEIVELTPATRDPAP
jgi:putative phosphoesterase